MKCVVGGQRPEQRLACRPGADAAVGIDMAQCAGVYAASAPSLSHRLACRKAAKRVIAGHSAGGGKRQGAQHRAAPVGHFGRQVFEPFPGGWGAKGATKIILASATEPEVLQALTAAWKNVAPKKLMK